MGKYYFTQEFYTAVYQEYACRLTSILVECHNTEKAPRFLFGELFPCIGKDNLFGDVCLEVHICAHAACYAKRSCYSRSYRYDELKYQLPSRFCIRCTHNFKELKG